jgi:hypothetical protein
MDLLLQSSAGNFLERGHFLASNQAAWMRLVPESEWAPDWLVDPHLIMLRLIVTTTLDCAGSPFCRPLCGAAKFPRPDHHEAAAPS